MNNESFPSLVSISILSIGIIMEDDIEYTMDDILEDLRKTQSGKKFMKILHEDLTVADVLL